MVSSLDAPDLAKQTQKDFPHLLVVSDHERGLANATTMVRPKSAPDGSDVTIPTSILVGRDGKVLWLHRPSRFIERLPIAELLAAVDQHIAVR